MASMYYLVSIVMLSEKKDVKVLSMWYEDVP